MGMRPPITIRPFSRVEARAVQAGLRSRDAFTLRRSQILLASGAGQRAPQIAVHVGTVKLSQGVDKVPLEVGG